MSTCPECGSWDTSTKATRKDTRYNWRWRYKECNECNHKFESYEIAVQYLTFPEEPANPNGRLIK